MQTEDINVPTEEPGPGDRTAHGDTETHAEPGTGLGREPEFDASAPDVKAEMERANQAASAADAVQRQALPFWISEKFHWITTDSGWVKLSPNPEFLAAIEADAPKAAVYGLTLVTEDSQESENAEQLIGELRPIVNTLTALHDREVNALKRFAIERVTLNAYYAATTQFELTNWAGRSAAAGKNAHDHQNFGEKESRMESFASACGVWHTVVKTLFPDADLSDVTFVKQARRQIYQQADMATRDQKKPSTITAEAQAAVDGAVEGVKRF